MSSPLRISTLFRHHIIHPTAMGEYVRSFIDSLGLMPTAVTATRSDFDLGREGGWQDGHFTAEGKTWGTKMYTGAIAKRIHANRKIRGARDKTQKNLQQGYIDDLTKRDDDCTAATATTAAPHDTFTVCPYTAMILEYQRANDLRPSCDEIDKEQVRITGYALIRNHQHRISHQRTTAPSEGQTARSPKTKTTSTRSRSSVQPRPRLLEGMNETRKNVPPDPLESVSGSAGKYLAKGAQMLTNWSTWTGKCFLHITGVLYLTFAGSSQQG